MDVDSLDFTQQIQLRQKLNSGALVNVGFIDPNYGTVTPADGIMCVANDTAVPPTPQFKGIALFCRPNGKVFFISGQGMEIPAGQVWQFTPFISQ